MCLTVKAVVTGVVKGVAKGFVKVTAENAEQLKQQKQQFRQNEIDRIVIEGKFDHGTRAGPVCVGAREPGLL